MGGAAGGATGLATVPGRKPSLLHQGWRHGLDRGCRDHGAFFDDMLGLDGHRFFDCGWSFVDSDFDGRNVVGGKFFDDRFGSNRSFFFFGLPCGRFHLSTELGHLGAIGGQSLQLGQGCHGLIGHAMSQIEANLFDGLVGLAGGGGFMVPHGAGGFDFRRFGRGFIGLHRAGVIPLRREINFRGRCARLGRLGREMFDHREFGLRGRLDANRVSFGRGPGRCGCGRGSGVFFCVDRFPGSLCGDFVDGEFRCRAPRRVKLGRIQNDGRLFDMDAGRRSR
jgi:hypothetical protein